MIINESEKVWEFGQFVGERRIGHRNYNTQFSGRAIAPSGAMMGYAAVST